MPAPQAQQTQQAQPTQPADDEASYDDSDEQTSTSRIPPIPNPLNLLKKGATRLSQFEADTLRPILIKALTTYSEEADRVISRTNRAHTELSEEAGNLIWSSLEPQEIETLVDGMLIIGQKQGHVAYAIRETARLYKLLEVGLILVPRFLATLQFYAQNGGLALW